MKLLTEDAVLVCNHVLGTVDVPPTDQGSLAHPAGSVLPSNSAPAVGRKMSSPSTVCATVNCASRVPAAKSATVPSTKQLAAGVLKLAGLLPAGGSVLELAAPSAEVAR